MNSSSNRQLMQGNEACVEGAIAAGMRFYAGYPITPSTEIAETSALRLPQVGGKFIQMEDEIASISAAIGASIAGVKAMTATSGPGFSLKQESIGYASMAEIPLVIVDVQRAGPSTGLPTAPSQGDVMQAKWGCHGDHSIIVLSPSCVQDCYSMAAKAFNYAEKYRVPVILLMDEMVGHLREDVETNLDFEIINRTYNFSKPAYSVGENLVPEFPPIGKGSRYNITGLVHNADGFPTTNADVADVLVSRILLKIKKDCDYICETEQYLVEDADTVLVCYGGTTGSVRFSVDELRGKGTKVGMLCVKTLWPSPEKQIAEIALKVKNMIVVEHNNGQYILEIERIAKGNCNVMHLGKINGTPITPEEITAFVEKINYAK